MKLTHILYCGLLALPLAGHAQVNFQSVSLSEAQKQSAEKGKYIFLDCQTKWCGACKAMAKNVFSTQEAGDFFNPNFVNVLMDMETPEGKEANKMLQVRAYPTFFILDSKGNVLHRIVGSRPKDKFIALVKQGMSVETSLGHLDSLYNQNKLQPSQYATYVAHLDEASKNKEVRAITNVIFRSLSDSDRIKQENWYLYKRTELLYPIDYMFQWLVDHKTQFDSTIGAEEVDNEISNVYQFTLRAGSNFLSKEDLAASIEIMPKQLASIDFKDKAFIQLWCRYKKATTDKDIPTILDIWENNLGELPFLEQITIPFQYDYIMKSDNKEWKKRFVQIEDKILPYMKTDQIKKAVKDIYAKYRQEL